jgi:hypothetical protein
MMSMSARTFERTTGKAWLAVLGAGTALLLLVGSAATAQPPSTRDARTVEGRVSELTTAPRGEVDGAVLSDGTTIHWPPHLADRFKEVVAKGDRVRATGWMETRPAGDTQLEVQTVTNLRTKASAENDAGPLSPALGPARVAPGGAGSREQRLRDLEDQLDQLRREIERLRRER